MIFAWIFYTFSLPFWPLLRHTHVLFNSKGIELPFQLDQFHRYGKTKDGEAGATRWLLQSRYSWLCICRDTTKQITHCCHLSEWPMVDNALHTGHLCWGTGWTAQVVHHRCWNVWLLLPVLTGLLDSNLLQDVQRAGSELFFIRPYAMLMVVNSWICLLLL